MGETYFYGSWARHVRHRKEDLEDYFMVGIIIVCCNFVSNTMAINRKSFIRLFKINVDDKQTAAI